MTHPDRAAVAEAHDAGDGSRFDRDTCELVTTATPHDAPAPM